MNFFGFTMDRKPSDLEIFLRRTLARHAMWVGFFVAYGIAFPFFLFTQLLEGSDAAVWACAILGLLAWWFARDADKGLPIEIFRKKTSRDAELTELDGELPLASSVVIRVITSKLAIPIGLVIAVGVSMLLWDFNGNIRRRSGFFHALISVFGQEGVAIVLGLFLGSLTFWWLNNLDQEISSYQKERVKKLINFRILFGENYIKVVLTSILVVLIVIAFLLSSN